MLIMPEDQAFLSSIEGKSITYSDLEKIIRIWNNSHVIDDRIKSTAIYALTEDLAKILQSIPAEKLENEEISRSYLNSLRLFIRRLENVSTHEDVIENLIIKSVKSSSTFSGQGSVINLDQILSDAIEIYASGSGSLNAIYLIQALKRVSAVDFFQSKKLECITLNVSHGEQQDERFIHLENHPSLSVAQISITRLVENFIVDYNWAKNQGKQQDFLNYIGPGPCIEGATRDLFEWVEGKMLVVLPTCAGLMNDCHDQAVAYLTQTQRALSYDNLTNLIWETCGAAVCQPDAIYCPEGKLSQEVIHRYLFEVIYLRQADSNEILPLSGSRKFVDIQYQRQQILPRLLFLLSMEQWATMEEEISSCFPRILQTNHLQHILFKIVAQPVQRCEILVPSKASLFTKMMHLAEPRDIIIKNKNGLTLISQAIRVGNLTFAKMLLEVHGKYFCLIDIMHALFTAMNTIQNHEQFFELFAVISHYLPSPIPQTLQHLRASRRKIELQFEITYEGHSFSCELNYPSADDERVSNEYKIEWRYVNFSARAPDFLENLILTQPEIARLIVKNPTHLAALTQHEHYNALYKACELNQVEIALSLLESPFSISENDFIHGRSATHFAVLHNQPMLLKKLLLRNACLFSQDDQGLDAFLLAIFNERFDLATIMLEHVIAFVVSLDIEYVKMCIAKCLTISNPEAEQFILSMFIAVEEGRLGLAMKVEDQFMALSSGSAIAAIAYHRTGNGDSFLHTAVVQFKPHFAKKLFPYIRDVLNRQGVCSLRLAVMTQQFELAEYMLGQNRVKARVSVAIQQATFLPASISEAFICKLLTPEMRLHALSLNLPLENICQNNHIRLLKDFLPLLTRDQIQTVGQEGPLLNIAIKYKNYELALLLLTKFAVDLPYKDAFKTASEQPGEEVDNLLYAMLSINQDFRRYAKSSNRTKMRILREAITNGDSAFLARCLSYKLPDCPVGEEFYSPFMLAMAKDDFKLAYEIAYKTRELNKNEIECAITRLLPQLPHPNAILNRLFIQACAHGLEALALRLLARGDINVNYLDIRTGNSALHYAVVLRQNNLFSALLLRPNLNINQLNYENLSALSVAITSGQLAIALTILDHPTGPNTKTINNAFLSLEKFKSENDEKRISCVEQETQLARRLHAFPQKSRMNTENGDNAAHHAVYTNRMSVLREAIECGEDLNQVNDSGFTPLSLALYLEHLDLACEILKQVDRLTPRTLGDALLYAFECDHERTEEIIKLLLTTDADCSTLMQIDECDLIDVAIDSGREHYIPQLIMKGANPFLTSGDLSLVVIEKMEMIEQAVQQLLSLQSVAKEEEFEQTRGLKRKGQDEQSQLNKVYVVPRRGAHPVFFPTQQERPEVAAAAAEEPEVATGAPDNSMKM